VSEGCQRDTRRRECHEQWLRNLRALACACIGLPFCRRIRGDADACAV